MVKQRGLAMKFSKFTKVAVYFAGLAAASAMLPGDASAGLFDMFKGRPAANANSSGRQVIAFQTKAEPGTIIVSFADRKLYYVNRAISYPIAGPKDGAEWAGEMVVTEKRVNPDWTPTADMRRFPPMCPEVIGSIRSASGRSISARARTGSTAPTRPGPSGRMPRAAASACSIRCHRSL
jgi:hypothetical protein